MEVNGCLELELVGTVYQEIQLLQHAGGIPNDPKRMIVFLAKMSKATVLAHRKTTGVGLLQLPS